MRLSIPTSFNIDYPQNNIQYYSAYGKKKLIPLLFNASKGYCMYCGKSIKNESDEDYQVEHSVDKAGNEGQEEDEITFLTHCKHNFSVTCKKCNLDCKKSVSKVDFGDIPHQKNCKKIDCTTKICDDYKQLREQYCQKNLIILQPQGYDFKGVKMAIQYNMIYNTYIPGTSVSEWEAYLLVIEHIRRFRLNGDRFSWSVVDIAAKIVNDYNRGIKDKSELIKSVKEYRPTNRIGCIFLEYIDSECCHISVEALVELCETLVVVSALD